MTDYTKSTNFGTKDSLPTGDAAKIVRGSEFDTEFNAIQTAVNSKANSSAPTFTGTATFATITATTVNTATFQIGGSSVTATPAELNKLDGVTVSTDELNRLAGVTDNIQDQLDAKTEGNQSITLSGDVSGSGTTSISVTVEDNSHSHNNSTITSVDASKVSTGTLADARIPSLNASKITAGVFANDRISQASVTQHQSAINAGQVDGKSISVVSSLPGSPDANTIYFVTS